MCWGRIHSITFTGQCEEGERRLEAMRADGRQYRVLLVVACVTAIASRGVGAALPGLTDALIHPPPATGPLAYNSFVPPVTQGASYVDPVFGTTVRQLTTDHVNDNIYARNMWWNADETRYLHFSKVIEVATGRVTHTGIPLGTSSADVGFDPVDSNVLYYLSGNQIRKVTLQAGGTWTDTLYFTAPAPLQTLGGTLNWLDASGRYMLVRYGVEPSVYLYDRQNLGAGPYANPLNGTNTIGADHYIGITPDGQYLVGYQAGVGVKGHAGVSWKINHATRAIAPAPTIFWSLCGDHGSFLSGSDGRNYMITFNCYDAPEVWRVDITNNANGLSAVQQKALPNNRRLLTLTWNDTGHVTTVARGPLQDWAFLATEDGTDTFHSGRVDANGNVTPWTGYRQEIIAINVLTGEVGRLAHHRSRSILQDYFASPRLSASWGGKVVGFASNFNRNGVNDIYMIPLSATFFPASISPTVPSQRSK